MKNRTDVFEEAGSLSPDLVAQRLGLLPFLMLSAWCGLVSGLLEVGVIILRKRTLDFNHLYWMSRHFVWLIPLINLLVFLILGLVLSVLVLRGGGRGRWLAIRLLCALTMLPPIWAASARIYGPAGALLALGLAIRLVPVLERHATGFRRLVRVSFPIVACLVPIPAASSLGRRPAARCGARSAAAPAAGLPKRSLDRVGHGGGRSSEPPWLQSPHQPDDR